LSVWSCFVEGEQHTKETTRWLEQRVKLKRGHFKIFPNKAAFSGVPGGHPG
jgi:hypothetical protein